MIERQHFIYLTQQYINKNYDNFVKIFLIIFYIITLYQIVIIMVYIIVMVMLVVTRVVGIGIEINNCSMVVNFIIIMAIAVFCIGSLYLVMDCFMAKFIKESLVSFAMRYVLS